MVLLEGCTAQCSDTVLHKSKGYKVTSSHCCLNSNHRLNLVIQFNTPFAAVPKLSDLEILKLEWQ